MKIPYDELFSRNSGTLSSHEQKKLKKSNIAIVGLGGTGGFVLENLVRVGVGNLVVFDSDRFELSNSNRQLLCNVKVMDEKKTKIASSRAKEINPKISVTTYDKQFTSTDSTKVSGCAILIDCSDNIETRHEISKACRKIKIPFVFSSASFSRGMVSVFPPGKKFNEVLPIKKSKTCQSVICVAPAVAGTLAAVQAINYLIGKPVCYAPEFIFFDLFAKEILWKKRI